MLASPWSEPPEGPNWIREVKWDGYRAELTKDGLLGNKEAQV